MLIFFYGTLRKGGGLNFKLEGVGQYIGVYHTLPKYTLYDMGCPCLSSGGDSSVIGEVYRLESLDQIAHIHSIETRAGYTLERVELVGLEEPTYAYFQTPNKGWNAPIIESGNWILYRDTIRYEVEDRA